MKNVLYMYDILDMLDTAFTPGTTKFSDWVKHSTFYDQDTLRDGREHIEPIYNRRMKKSNHFLFIGTNMKLIPENIKEGLEIRILPESSKTRVGTAAKWFRMMGLHYFFIYDIRKQKVTEEFMVSLIIEG